MFWSQLGLDLVEEFWTSKYSLSPPGSEGLKPLKLLGKTATACFPLLPVLLGSGVGGRLPCSVEALASLVSLPLGSSPAHCRLVPLPLSLETSVPATIFLTPQCCCHSKPFSIHLGEPRGWPASQFLTLCACDDLNLSHSHHSPATVHGLQNHKFTPPSIFSAH